MNRKQTFAIKRFISCVDKHSENQVYSMHNSQSKLGPENTVSKIYVLLTDGVNYMFNT